MLDKARRAVRAAELLLDAGETDFAMGRAYYAMFYAAEAALLETGLKFRKHSGVHAAFGEQLARTGKVDPKYHRLLLDAFDKRIVGDYDVEYAFSPEDCRQTIEQAREFISAVAAFLRTT